MKTDNDHVNKEHNEIDLVLLFKIIKRGIVNIFGSFLKLLIFLKKLILRYYIFIIILVFLSVVFGAVTSYRQETNFKSHLVVNSNILSNGLLSSSFDELNQLCLNKDFKELSLILNIEENQANNIISLSILNKGSIILSEYNELIQQDQQVLYSDTVIRNVKNDLLLKYKNSFFIEIETINNKKNNELTIPIVNYIKNIPYVFKRYKIDVEQLRLNESFIDVQLNQLDSLMKIVALDFNSKDIDYENGSNNIVLAKNEKVNPLKIIATIKEKFTRKLYYQKMLYQNSNVELYYGFTKAKKEKVSIIKIIKTLLKYSFYGFVIAFLMISFFAFNNYLKSIELDNKKHN